MTIGWVSDCCWMLSLRWGINSVGFMDLLLMLCVQGLRRLV